MPDEPIEGQTPTPEPTPEPTPPPAPEIEPPTWLSEPIQPPAAPQTPAAPYQPPQPVYVPPPQPQYPSINPDDLVNKTGEVIYRTAEQVVNPVMQRLQALDTFMRQSFEGNLSASVNRANAGIADGWRNVFAKDPAIGNKQVLQTVDNLVRQQRQQAIEEAYRTGNFASLDQFNNPKYYQAALAVAKVHVGYPGGQAPQALNVQGAYTESSRSAPSAGSEDEIPEGVKEAAERLRVDPRAMWKRLQAQEEEKKKLGWKT